MSSNQTHALVCCDSVASVEALEALLGLDELNLGDLKILSIADQADKFYASFTLKKKSRPFASKPVSKKPRPIDAPILTLKSIQRRINERILAHVALPGYILGGVKGKSIIQNAQMHQGARVLVKLDIKSYFSSITSVQILYVWSKILGFPLSIAALLTKLTTHKGRLPQGAPTSTSLANIFLHSIDQAIRMECERLGVVYSVWVDDLIFSGADARQIIDVAIRVLTKAGLSISRQKLKVAGPGMKKLATGVVLGATLSVPRELRSQLRAGVHNLRTGKVPADQRDDYVKALEGGIAHVKSVNKDQVKKLIKDFEVAKKIAFQAS